MAVQKYDIPMGATGDFNVKYWVQETFPVLNERNEIEIIVYSLTDVTRNIKSRRKIRIRKIKLRSID